MTLSHFCGFIKIWLYPDGNQEVDRSLVLMMMIVYGSLAITFFFSGIQQKKGGFNIHNSI